MRVQAPPDQADAVALWTPRRRSSRRSPARRTSQSRARRKSTPLGHDIRRTSRISPSEWTRRARTSCPTSNATSTYPTARTSTKLTPVRSRGETTQARSIRRLARATQETGNRARDWYARCAASIVLPGGAREDRAWALVRTARIAGITGDFAQARGWLNEADVLLEELEDLHGRADALGARCLVELSTGNFDQTLELAEQLAALVRILPDAVRVGCRVGSRVGARMGASGTSRGGRRPLVCRT